MDLSRAARVIAFLLGTLLCGLERTAEAHELQVDQLSFFPAVSGKELLGQLIFDPELTRPTDEKLAFLDAKARIVEFVKQEIQVSLDGTVCKLQIEVRELYDGSGATAGDVVNLACPLGVKLPVHEMFVRIGQRFPALTITAPSLSPDGSQFNVTEMTLTGTRSSSFRFKTQSELARASQTHDAEVPSEPPRLQSWPELLAVYLKLGFLHIIPQGLDHVLFVIGVAMGAGSWRSMLIQLSVFSLGHTMSLGLAFLGFISLSSAIIEPLIALTIAALGFENLIQTSPTARFRVPLVFVFGLIHGLGFAGALHEKAPQLGSFLLALLGFNFGVEGGQIVVAGLTAGLLLCLKRVPNSRRRLIRACSAALIVSGLYWAGARILGASGVQGLFL